LLIRHAVTGDILFVDEQITSSLNVCEMETETFTWTPAAGGMYTARVLDPMTGATVASGGIFVP
jgi:hypothetical protein